MNKTLIYITFIALVALALAGTVLIILVVPQHFGSFTGFIVVLIGLAGSFAATVSSLERTKQEVQNIKTETSAKLDVVQRQTNGTLSKLIETVEEKDDIIKRKDRRIADLEASLLNKPKKGILEHD